MEHPYLMEWWVTIDGLRVVTTALKGNGWDLVDKIIIPTNIIGNNS